MDKQYYVYILASRPNGALYVGVTSDLIKRVYQHREGMVEGHTRTYNIHQLVYYETYGHIDDAILREKRLKKWTRAMKNDLISQGNPMWEDMYPSLATV